MVPEVSYLNYKISESSVKWIPEKVLAVDNVPKPVIVS